MITAELPNFCALKVSVVVFFLAQENGHTPPVFHFHFFSTYLHGKWYMYKDLLGLIAGGDVTERLFRL